MADGDSGERLFSLGNVFSRAFAVMRTAPVPVFATSFLLAALPQGVWDYVVPRVTSALEAQNPYASLAVILVGLFFSVALISLAQAALVPIMLAHAERRSTSLWQSLTIAFAAILPVFGLSIVITLGVWGGMLLLLVPGLVLLVMWSVAIPALVGEHRGISGALGRSRYLSKGVRWQIFGFMLFLIAISIGTVMVIYLAAAAMGLDSDAVNGQQPMPIHFGLFSVMWNTLLTGFASALSVSLYIELRMWKDGLSQDHLTEVFA